MPYRDLCKRTNIAITAVFVAAVSAELSHAQDVVVDPSQPSSPPNRYATIQEALDGATGRQRSVVLLDGVYKGPRNKNLTFGGKEIALYSHNGPRNCIIDCEGDGRGFDLSNNDSGVVLQGITIRAGSAIQGGAIRIDRSHPTIVDCVFVNNAATSNGGAIFGIQFNGCVRKCVFVGNAAPNGSAVSVWSSATDFVACIFRRNRASSGPHRGVIEVGSGRPILLDAVFAGNFTRAISNRDSGRPMVINSTFVGNSAVVHNAGGVATVINSIAWGNGDDAFFGANPIQISFSCIEGGWAGTGNIDFDPMFVDARGPDGVLGPEDDNLRLWAGSPCIDAGDNSARNESISLSTCLFPTVDSDGHDRFIDDPEALDVGNDLSPIVDMGAHEKLANDCNGNLKSDDVDLMAGSSLDCNANAFPDECEIAIGLSNDCNANGIPDKCDFIGNTSTDCNINGIPDECDLVDASSADCNSNMAPDECDISTQSSVDCNANGVPDECEPDCNENFVADACDLTEGMSADCNSTGIPDECEIATIASTDCNENGVPDECETDCNNNHVSDKCELSALSFESIDTPRPVPDQGTVGSTHTVVDVPISFLVQDVNVALDIAHSFDRDLTATLVSPSGTEVLLFRRAGGSGRDFRETTLDDEAAEPIASGFAPFNGPYRPEGRLSDFRNENAKGTWTLQVVDDQAGDSGTIHRWALLFPATSTDCDADGVPDDCQPDGDGDGIIDACELPGDLDGDGDVDLADYLQFQAAFTGPGIPTAHPDADLDADGDTDLSDLMVFLTALELTSSG